MKLCTSSLNHLIWHKFVNSLLTLSVNVFMFLYCFPFLSYCDDDLCMFLCIEYQNVRPFDIFCQQPQQWLCHIYSNR